MSGRNTAFIYWGRRGFSRFTLAAAHAARENGLNAYFSISTSNELYPEFSRLDDIVFPVDTFRIAPGALLNLARLPQLRRSLVDWLTERDVKSVIALMPHVWMPFISGSLKRHGMHYAVVFHDGKPHPGDATGIVFNWLLHDAKAADTIVTLSDFTRNELLRRGVAPAARIKSVSMPDLVLPGVRPHNMIRARSASSPPLRVLFLGRLMRYKGLALFADAMQILIDSGVPIQISVCGEGRLGGLSSRLERLGAVIINKWLSDDEVGELLACHDAMVLTHVEASQSGLISLALGARLPLVTTPAGGLPEQVQPREAGLVADRIDATAVANCVRTLALDYSVYNRIVDNIRSTATFTMAKFLRDLGAAVDASKADNLTNPQSHSSDSADPWRPSAVNVSAIRTNTWRAPEK